MLRHLMQYLIAIPWKIKVKSKMLDGTWMKVVTTMRETVLDMNMYLAGTIASLMLITSP